MVFVAFLRAINLGRVNRVPMADLRRVLTDTGFSHVMTHLQSGNVVLKSAKRSSTAVAGEIEQRVEAKLGVDTDVMARTSAELAKIVSANPLARGRTGAGALHVAFLKSPPTPSARRALSARTFDDDEFVIRGSEIFLRYPHGVAGSKMNTALFESALGTPGTVRTWKVVTRLSDLAGTVG